jgi:hypothetical protein
VWQFPVLPSAFFFCFCSHIVHYSHTVTGCQVATWSSI